LLEASDSPRTSFCPSVSVSDMAFPLVIQFLSSPAG
jgi:hypothetical protein